MRFTAVTLNQGNLPNGSHFVSASMSIKNKTLDADCDIVSTKDLVATYDRPALRTECDDHSYKRHIEERTMFHNMKWGGVAHHYLYNSETASSHRHTSKWIFVY